MRTLKLIVWIAALFIIETVFAQVIDVNGMAPGLLMAFSVAFALRERETGIAGIVIIICGILSATETGRSFPLTLTAAGLSGAAACFMRTAARPVPVWLKNAVITLFTAFLLASAEYMTARGTITAEGLFGSVLVYTAYTLAAGAVLCPIAGRVFFRETKEDRLLIV